ncbi:b5aa7e62-8470-40dc-8c8e-b36c82441ea0 [Thermothielavioides terrestris]|uniref:B5aa7e62-8470-40dc-8c8e-b36c82441ea0 n=1 Tax=Thermothielavioides terrestris TaxID=2587410 RepID=A0A446BXH3_9PEZI|nr:b5aa7e62-8470-40dc-8c8e-b36c82441ea0 [Thermothielavioides terrestris]
MTIYKWDRLTIFAFNVWYDDYDWATAHHKVDLPVVLVDYGKKVSTTRVCGQEFRDEVNHFVARQHELHGWDSKPPYLEDHTLPSKVPTYPNPRCVTFVGPDGITRRQIKTPPPGSTSAYASEAGREEVLCPTTNAAREGQGGSC